jgi:NTP pyrophosphatase (non-canonical NTP hydrolase)
MATCYGILEDGKVTHTAWTREDLLLKTGHIDPKSVIEIEVPPIIEVVEWYFAQRGLFYAQDPVDAFLFLTSEIGEVADALVHGRGQWVRNHDKERNAREELGDVAMMMYVTAERLGTDPIEEMLAKFAKKGYPFHE